MRWHSCHNKDNNKVDDANGGRHMNRIIIIKKNLLCKIFKITPLRHTCSCKYVYQVSHSGMRSKECVETHSAAIHATMKILKQKLAMKRRAHIGAYKSAGFSVYVVIVILREISFLAINTIVTTGYAFKH
uniref:Uncharacterized protein n=1 Tax=Glossina austeni TaxID=7395 RepID=A0A1A9V1V9_GLOAU